MAEISSRDLTKLLGRWSEGEESALEKLTPFVYRELYRLAAGTWAASSPVTRCRRKHW